MLIEHHHILQVGLRDLSEDEDVYLRDYKLTDLEIVWEAEEITEGRKISGKRIYCIY